MELTKLFPNVKNVLSYTERELEELESEIEMLRTDTRYNDQLIDTEEAMEDELYEFGAPMGKHHGKRRQEYVSYRPSNEATVMDVPVRERVVPKHKQQHKEESPKDFSRLDRIKNNLKVIEGKLQKL